MVQVQEYNVTCELPWAPHPTLIADIADARLGPLMDYHPAVVPTPNGRIGIVLTIPAESLRQAVTTALVLVRDAVSVDATTTREYDAAVTPPVPELVSVTQAAELLGVTRQAVLDRVRRGTLPGAQRVGNAVVIPRAAVASR